MNRTVILLVVALLLAVIGGMFIFSFLKSSGGSDSSTPDMVDDSVMPVEEEKFTITRIDAKHYYTMTPQGGVHTIAGELMMPTACDLLSPSAVLLGDGKQAQISFDVVNNSEGECEAKPTPQRFKIGFKADKDIQFDAVYQGNPVPLNLVEAGAGESPADFELNIKG